MLQCNRSNTELSMTEDSFNRIKDSLISANSELEKRNILKTRRIRSLIQFRDSVSSRISSLDVSIDKETENHEKNTYIIENLSTDSTIRLLSTNLSQKDNN
jgi:hypothetical protein